MKQYKRLRYVSKGLLGDRGNLRSNLQQGGDAGNRQQRRPEATHGLERIHVAGIAKSIRHARDGHGDDEEEKRQRPADNGRKVEELGTRYDVMAYLEIHGEGAQGD